METNNTFAEDINLSANDVDKAVKKQWIKPQMRTLLISSSTTIWDEETFDVAPEPS